MNITCALTMSGAHSVSTGTGGAYHEDKAAGASLNSAPRLRTRAVAYMGATRIRSQGKSWAASFRRGEPENVFTDLYLSCLTLMLLIPERYSV
jgi:hypothetical protein